MTFQIDPLPAGAPGDSNHTEAPTLAQIHQSFASLTPKQREICRMMADGLLSKQIAYQLGTSINTVKSHRMEIFRKMGAHSLLDLARMVDLLSTEAHPPASAKSPVDQIDFRARRTEAPTRILVVEDNKNLREVMVTLLSDLGYDVIGLADGEGINQVLAQGPVDIVLLDICLGEDHEDGYALAARLRRHSSCGIIMTTALGEREARIRGLDQGADAYLVKPVDFKELDATIRSVLRRLRPGAAQAGVSP